MFDILLLLVIVVAAIWLAARLFLRGKDHSAYDEPRLPNVSWRDAPSAGRDEIVRRIDELAAEMQAVPMRERNGAVRRLMDDGLLGAPVSESELGVRTETTDAGGVPGEWVLAPGCDPDRRLLYLHGGGFYAGSPRSARMITASLSKLAGVAVLAIDYRLMPENRRLDCVDDCQAAYRWMLENGPEGQGAAEQVFVAGDSAGGNLALMLSAWSRDEGPRPTDAVVAFSPSTDSTLVAPSYRANVATDPMLGPAIGPLVRLPATLIALLGWLLGRANPSDPVSSPLFDDLQGLPPTLIQATDCEMLVDDSRRYANKAISQGSPVELQIWPGLVHVFQMFGHILPEANEALERAAEFIAGPRGSGVTPNKL